jgi:hypothetical protein
VQLDLEVDVSDPATPEAYVLDSSLLTASVYIDEPGLEIEGSIGALGLEFDDGSLVLADDRTSPSPSQPATFTVGLADDADGRYPLEEVDDASLETSSTGEIDVDFRVTQESAAQPEPDRFHFSVGNLNDVPGTTNLVSSPDFPNLLAWSRRG